MGCNKLSRMTIAALCGAAGWLISGTVGAQTPNAQQGAQPASVQKPPEPARGAVVHHAPVSTATVHQPLSLAAAFDSSDRMTGAMLVYSLPSGVVREVPFRRASQGPYLAIIPEQEMAGPWVAYAIELVDANGKRTAGFATRSKMFVVQVPEDVADLREREMAARHGNRRSVVTTSAEYVDFGSTTVDVTTDARPVLHPESVRDSYYRLEGAYTYRPWSTIAEFSIRLGVVRGTSVVPGETRRDKYDVGLNYGSPSVRFRLDDAWHLEAQFLTSVTEVGFSTGAGGALLIGDPYGSKLTLGFETIQVFGTRFYSRLDITGTKNMMVAPIVEVTDMPHADRYGVRLLTELRWNLGAGFVAGLRGGYQARRSTGGGPAVGATFAYAF